MEMVATSRGVPEASLHAPRPSSNAQKKAEHLSKQAWGLGEKSFREDKMEPAVALRASERAAGGSSCGLLQSALQRPNVMTGKAVSTYQESEWILV